jgi:repressor LexA|nr:MAG TPA: Repressor protein CI [Caudoviricetes sp.]
MEMNEKIRMLRKQNGLTLEEVGKLVGVGKSTVRKWENGQIANMRRDKIAKLASALHTTPAYLMGWEDEQESEPLPPDCFPIHMNKVPLVGTIACGTPILAAENIEDHVDIPDDIRADFALRCKGDSMMGIKIQIHDGDVVYIRKQSDVDNGTIAAVLIGEEATLKRVYKQKDKLILQPENPDYPPMVYTDQELDEIRIIGKAVAFMSRID